jgi:hypothetical protein
VRILLHRLVLVAVILGLPSMGMASPKALPIEWCRSLPVALLETEDGTVFRMILDTGASGSWIDPEALQQITGKVPSGSSATLRSLSLGPMTIHRLPVGLHDFTALERTLGSPVDGILGYHAFVDLTLVLDGPAREIRVSTEGLDADRGGVFRLSRRERTRPFFKASIAGRTRHLLVDSGGTGPFGLHAKRHLRWHTAPLPLRSSMRFNRMEEHLVGRLNGPATFGGVTFSDPIVEILPDDATEIMGQDILAHLVVALDGVNRLATVVASSDAPITMDPVVGHGAVFRVTPSGFEVTRVAEGSPAAAAELQKGDMVTRLNDRSIFDRPCGAEPDPTADLEMVVERYGTSRRLIVTPLTLIP